MIVYKLKCRKGHEFEGWFKSSSAFEDQAAASKVVCPVCGAKKVTRAPMAPAVRSSGRGPSSAEQEQALQVREALLELRSKVESSADYVGPRFADEARSMHHGDTEKRSIYGETTPEEARDLHDEGIEFGVIPWVERGDA